MSGIYDRSSIDRYYESMLNDHLRKLDEEEADIEVDETEEENKARKERIKVWLEEIRLKFKKQ